MTSRSRDWLPTEVPVPATWRRVLVMLVVTLLGVLALNFLAGLALERWTTNRGYWLIREKWRLLESMSAPVDWLILGDSACNQGIDPSIVAAELGGTAINLCTVGDMLAVNDAWMLDRHIERFGPPKHVIVAHVFDVWCREMRSLTTQPLLAKVPLEWGFWRGRKPTLRLKPPQVQQLMLARYAPLWAENTTLASWLRHPALLWDRHMELTPEGFMPHDTANPTNVRRDSKSSIDWVTKHPFKMSAINRKALEHIRALADQHGFDVYLAPAPLYDGLWDKAIFRGHYQAMLVTLDEIASTSPLLHVIHETDTYPIEALENADHVVGPAATDFTRKLVARIKVLAARSGPAPAVTPP